MFNEMQLSERDWVEAIVNSPQVDRLAGVLLPKLPSDQVQKQFVGSTGSHALREASQFYQVVRKYIRDKGNVLGDSSKILDFGCGWGRIQRFFLKDVLPDNITGIDVDPEIVEICRECLPQTQNFTTTAFPPTVFPDNSFDIIVAYSVFSHLSRDAHMAWVREFRRLLKPQGLVFATTHGAGFLDFCSTLIGQEHEFPWHRAIAQEFSKISIDEAKQRYGAGEFIFVPTGGGAYRPSTFYGEAIVPEGFVRNHWQPALSIVDYRQADEILPQSLIVARKPATLPKAFVIGWQKTGTTSIHQALGTFGYRVLADVEWYNSWCARGVSISNLLSLTDRFDAAKDYPWPLLYKELNAYHRGEAKFILTVRNTERWVESLRQHLIRNPGQPSTRHLYGRELDGKNLSAEDIRCVVAKYEAHNRAVTEYFAGSNNLLTLDLERPTSWRELTTFLGGGSLSPPTQAFPHENRWEHVSLEVENG